MNTEELVKCRILKFAYVINKETNKNVMLPNSSIASRDPVKTRQKAKLAIAKIA